MLKIKVREAIETPALIDLQMDEKNTSLLAKMASHSDAEVLTSMIVSAIFDKGGALNDVNDHEESIFPVWSYVAVSMRDIEALNKVHDFILATSMQ